jgi:hypothetical protein
MLGLPASTVRDWIRAFRRRGSPWPEGWDTPGYSWQRASALSDGLLLAPVGAVGVAAGRPPVDGRQPVGTGS